MRIYLIRHGETTGDVENRYGGDYEDHLSGKGRQQAKELAKKLQGKGIQIIYFSSRIRAKETVEIVNQILKIKSEVVNDLRERNNYGILTGLKKSEAKEKYPEEVEELSKGFNHHVTSSESYELFKKRIVNSFEKIVNNDQYGVIAIVMHGGPIKCIFREILKLEPREIVDCGVIELEKKYSKILLIH